MPWIFLAAATVGGLFFFPRTLIVLIAGMIFGVGYGALLSEVSAILSALAAFYLTRFVSADIANFIVNRLPRLKRAGDTIESANFSFVLFVRFLHLPFSVVNFFLALLPISFKNYLIATAIGLLPGTVVLAFLGHQLGCELLEGKKQLPPEAMIFLAGGMLFLAALSLLPWVINRRKLSRRGTPPKTETLL
jgi:uncharacterized membrane protein YdjX (TVP38/TMEM64 family)